MSEPRKPDPAIASQLASVLARCNSSGYASDGTFTATFDQIGEAQLVADLVSRLVPSPSPNSQPLRSTLGVDEMAEQALSEHRAGETRPLPECSSPETDFQSTLSRMRQTLDDMERIPARLAENSKAREAL